MNGPDAQRYTEDMIKGWKDPAPYPFVLAGVTPSLGTEHLIVPAGAGHLGVFSLASGLMVHSFNLPGVGNDDIAAMTTLRNPNPTGEVSSAFVPTKGAAGGVGASVRALLAVATSSYKGVRIYALDEGAAQVARVMDTRAEVACLRTMCASCAWANPAPSAVLPCNVPMRRFVWWSPGPLRELGPAHVTQACHTGSQLNSFLAVNIVFPV